MAEVIGAALVESASLPVRVILTDLLDVLPLAELRAEPVFCVGAFAVAGDELDEARAGGARVAGCELQVAQGCESLLDGAHELLAALVAHVDLAEPFERIRAALAEAQAEPHDDSEKPADELGAAA